MPDKTDTQIQLVHLCEQLQTMTVRLESDMKLLRWTTAGLQGDIVLEMCLEHTQEGAESVCSKQMAAEERDMILTGFHYYARRSTVATWNAIQVLHQQARACLIQIGWENAPAAAAHAAKVVAAYENTDRQLQELLRDHPG